MQSLRITYRPNHELSNELLVAAKVWMRPKRIVETRGGRMKNPSKKKGLNGRRTKTSKRKAPKRTEKTETVNAKKKKMNKEVLSTNIQ